MVFKVSFCDFLITKTDPKIEAYLIIISRLFLCVSFDHPWTCPWTSPPKGGKKGMGEKKRQEELGGSRCPKMLLVPKHSLARDSHLFPHFSMMQRWEQLDACKHNLRSACSFRRSGCVPEPQHHTPRPHLGWWTCKPNTSKRIEMNLIPLILLALVPPMTAKKSKKSKKIQD